jgi:hypothetical protein
MGASCHFNIDRLDTNHGPNHPFPDSIPTRLKHLVSFSLAAFRKSNRGAPHILIVSSSDESGPLLASRLGYDDCKTGHSGARQLAICKASTRLSVAHE